MAAFVNVVYRTVSGIPNVTSAPRHSPPRRSYEGVGILMAYLEVTMLVDPANRGEAAGVYQKYLRPFLDTVPGATSKNLLVRDEDVQVLHGFKTADDANAYLQSDLFNQDVVAGLS